MPRHLATVTRAQETLPWSEYFVIRKSKRKWEMVSLFELQTILSCSVNALLQFMTLPFTVLGFFGGITYFGSLGAQQLLFAVQV